MLRSSCVEVRVFCAEKRRGGVRPMSKELIKGPAKPRSRGIDPAQGVLDLGIYPQTEMRGFGMGVLSDGTPYPHATRLGAALRRAQRAYRNHQCRVERKPAEAADETHTRNSLEQRRVV